MLTNKKRKCGNCGIVNWRESDNCFNCDKDLNPSANVYGQPTTSSRPVHSKKNTFLSFKLGATTALILTIITIVAVGFTVYLNSTVDKTSKVSQMTMFYWKVTPPNKKLLWEAVSAAVVVEPEDSGKVIQEPALSYKKDCEPLSHCPTNALMMIDQEHSRPTILESESVGLNDFFVISSRVDKVKASAGKPEFIRYTAKVEADINRFVLAKEIEFKTGKDWSKKTRESSQAEITLRWNPTIAGWELP